MTEILAGIAEEEHSTEGLTWKEFLLPANRFRVFVSVTIQIGKSEYLAYSPRSMLIHLKAFNSPATHLSHTVSP
jgi:hypothetical protein